ncbi:hypothetical protein ACVOMV_23225 [Mesorhizobium atlanticum]
MGGAVEVRRILPDHRDPRDPVTDFGALAPIYGTIVTSAVVIIIAVPIGIGICIAIPTELSPRRLGARSPSRSKKCSPASSRSARSNS